MTVDKSTRMTSTVSSVTQKTSRKIVRVQGQLIRSLARKENLARTSIVRLVRPTSEQLATSTAKSLAADDGSLRTFSGETTRVDPLASSLTSHWNAEFRPKNETLIGTVGDDLAANKVTTPHWQLLSNNSWADGAFSTKTSWDPYPQVAFTKSSAAKSYLPSHESANGTTSASLDMRQNVTHFFTEVLSGMNLDNSSGESDNDTLFDCNSLWKCNSTNETKSDTNLDMNGKDYWALLLVLFPLFTVFGNVLVILSVYKERSLQTATNYFIVSLAIADLLVAALVMPFAVYVLVNLQWDLPAVVCDFYIAMDVTCSTSSIFNLVAISIDRFIAVTQPIKYARHKNHGRIWLTIALVWVISAAIGSPIVLGLNHTPSRDPTLCVFYNSDFVIYSSLSSFYIPCIIMVFLYYRIFKAIRERAKKAVASRKSNAVMGNLAHTKRLAETALGSSSSPVLPLATIGSAEAGAQGPGVGSPVLPSITKQRLHQTRIEEEDKITDQGSASQDEEEDYERDVEEVDGWDEGSALPRDTSTEFILTTQNEITSKLKPGSSLNGDTNGNQDSGYVPALIDDKNINSRILQERRKKRERHKEKADSGGHESPAGVDSTCSANKDAKAGSRFTIYKVNKASRKKREKSSAKKERKATKTLAIVLGVFLICWVPFFTCNIMDAICSKLQLDCQPGVTAFILTTWLGYINSFINPVIYTIFNLEFRKAFKRILICAD